MVSGMVQLAITRGTRRQQPRTPGGNQRRVRSTPKNEVQDGARPAGRGTVT